MMMCNGTMKAITVRNEIGIEFTQVIPLVQLKGWNLTCLGKSYSWWHKDGMYILVSREMSNKMLHGAEPVGIIDSFPDKKCSTNLIYKFITLFEISMIGMPKSI